MRAAMGEREPPEEPTEDDLVDEASKQSFPASDPPSFWARGPRPERTPAASGEPAGR